MLEYVYTLQASGESWLCPGSSSIVNFSACFRSKEAADAYHETFRQKCIDGKKLLGGSGDLPITVKTRSLEIIE